MRYSPALALVRMVRRWLRRGRLIAARSRRRPALLRRKPRQGPPQHWLQLVAEHAPQLLEDRLVAIGDGPRRPTWTQMRVPRLPRLRASFAGGGGSDAPTRRPLPRRATPPDFHATTQRRSGTPGTRPIWPAQRAPARPATWTAPAWPEPRERTSLRAASWDDVWDTGAQPDGDSEWDPDWGDEFGDAERDTYGQPLDACSAWAANPMRPRWPQLPPSVLDDPWEPRAVLPAPYRDAVLHESPARRRWVEQPEDDR